MIQRFLVVKSSLMKLNLSHKMAAAAADLRKEASVAAVETVAAAEAVDTKKAASTEAAVVDTTGIINSLFSYL